MIDTDKYETMTMNDMEHLELWEFSRKLFTEVKRLREENNRYLDFILWLGIEHKGKKLALEFGDEKIAELVE